MSSERAARAALSVLSLVVLSLAGPLTATGPSAAAAPPAAKGTAPRPPRPGLQISAREFRGRVRAVALVPLFFSRIPADAAALKARYDSLLAAELRHAGLRAIPARVWTEEKRGVTDSAGIAVDKTSGRPDLKKADAIVAETKRRVSQRHGGFEALVYPSVRRAEEGWFLHVDIVSAKDALLYQGDGEILRVAPTGKGPGRLPPYDSFQTDPTRDARAVKAALQPLAQALGQK